MCGCNVDVKDGVVKDGGGIGWETDEGDSMLEEAENSGGKEDVADGIEGVADNGTVVDSSDETLDSCCGDVVSGGSCETIDGGDTEQGLVGEMVEEDVGSLLDLYNVSEIPLS